MKFVIVLDENVPIMFLFSHFTPSPEKRTSTPQSPPSEDSKSVKNERLNFRISLSLSPVYNLLDEKL